MDVPNVARANTTWYKDRSALAGKKNTMTDAIVAATETKARKYKVLEAD